MQLIEVTTDALAEEFLDLPDKLYKSDKNYIRPLDSDIRNVFDKKTNVYFNYGKAVRYLLKDDSGQYIGRIAAYYDEYSAMQDEIYSGAFGFFECINDQEAANMLFNAAKKWLSTKGVLAINGPVNFGDKTMWWGLMTEGDLPPTYAMNYNHLYYKDLFENYGMKPYFNLAAYQIDTLVQLPEKYKEKAAQLLSPEGGYRIEKLSREDPLDKLKDFLTIYNNAFGTKQKAKAADIEHGIRVFSPFYPFMDPELIQFLYYKDEPVAFIGVLPDPNEYIRNNKKEISRTEYNYLIDNNISVSRKLIGIISAVVPEHRDKGLLTCFATELQEVFRRKKRWDHIEFRWVADYNPKMITVMENLNGKIVKKHTVYRIHFDNILPVEKLKL